jgi:hypothetical protein
VDGRLHAGCNGDKQTFIFAGALGSSTVTIAGCALDAESFHASQGRLVKITATGTETGVQLQVDSSASALHTRLQAVRPLLETKRRGWLVWLWEEPGSATRCILHQEMATVHV